MMARKVQTQKIHSFTAVFEPAEEGGYTVTIPVLAGCISEGDTFEEAVRNIQEAALLYLGVLREERQTIPEERGTVVAPISVRA